MRTQVSYIVAPGLKFTAKYNKDELTTQEIVRTCQAYFGENPFKRSRVRSILECRKFCIFFMRQRTSLSLKHIGMVFNQDHTTVIHTLRSMNDLLETDTYMRAHYNSLTNLLR